MGTATGSHLSGEKVEGEGGRRALSGRQSGKYRWLSRAGYPLLQRMESSSILRRGQKGWREKPPELVRLWHSRNLGREQSCQWQGQGEESQVCLCPDGKVRSQRVQGLRTLKAKK